MTLAVADEGFLAREDELDRAARLPDEEAEEAFDRHVLLAAEAAAEIRPLQPHATVREPEHVGHVAEVLEHLGAHPERQRPLRVDPADSRLRLQVDVVDERRAVGVLDHHLGPAEPLADIALAEPPTPEDVAALVDDGGAGTERVEGIEDAGQLLVVDLDQFGGAVGDLRRLGGDGDHGLALEADAIRRQHRLGGEHGSRRRLGHAPRQLHAQLVARHVGVGEDRRHTGKLRGRARVDPHDAGGGVGAPHDPPVEHPRQREIARVDGPAAHLLPRVRPRRTLADHAIAGIIHRRGCRIGRTPSPSYPSPCPLPLRGRGNRSHVPAAVHRH